MRLQDALRDETVSSGNGIGTPAHPQRIAKEPQGLAVPQPEPDGEAWTPCPCGHIQDSHGRCEYGCNCALYLRSNSSVNSTADSPDTRLREAAHIVEQQGLALGRLRAAAQAVVDGAWRRDGEETATVPLRLLDALRAALEEAPRG